MKELRKIQYLNSVWFCRQSTHPFPCLLLRSFFSLIHSLLFFTLFPFMFLYLILESVKEACVATPLWLPVPRAFIGKQKRQKRIKKVNEWLNLYNSNKAWVKSLIRHWLRPTKYQPLLRIQDSFMWQIFLVSQQKSICVANVKDRIYIH